MNARRLATLCCLILTGCSRPAAPAEEVKHYAIHGQVVRLDGKDKLATIKHQKIEGFMGAMTMDFPVRDDKEFSSLHEGDKIDGTVFVQGLDYWVGDIHAQPGAVPEEKK
jgi:Cu/Ag efflux protein CusF